MIEASPAPNGADNSIPPSQSEGSIAAANSAEPLDYASDPKSAKRALEQQLIFHETQAEDLLKQIIRLLTQQSPHALLLAKLTQLLFDNHKTITGIASQLAPYQHAKMAAIDIKSTKVTRFVIQAPGVANNREAWLKEVGNESLEQAQIADQTKMLSALHQINKLDYSDSETEDN